MGPANPLKIDGVEGSCDSVEPGRVDEDVELEVFVAGLNALFVDTLDGVIVDINQLDVGLVEDLIIAAL